MNRQTVLALASLIGASLVMVAMAASPPSAVSYQGVLRDASGIPLQGNVDMVVRFWSAPTGGDEILVDQHTAGASEAVTVDSGLFSVELGGGMLLDGAGPGVYASLTDVFRDYGDVYVGVQVGADSEMTPRLRVLSTAFALNADRLDGLNSDDFALAGHDHDGQYLGAAGGSLSGALSLPADGLDVGGGQLAVASGRVGVGTAAPQNPLHVAGSSGQYSNLADGVHLGIDASNNTHIELIKNGGSPYIDFNNTNSGDTRARIRLAASDRLDIESPKLHVNGQLGLGTTNPSSRLHVADGGLTVDGGSTSSPISLVAGTAPSNGIGGAIDLSAGGGYNDRGGHVSLQSGNTSSWSSFGNSSDVWLRGGTVDGETSFAEVRVQGGRAVAGGTTSSDGGTLTLRGGNGTGSNRHGGDVVLLPGLASGSGTAGRVGIGTTTPAARLDVAGGDIRTDGRLVSTLGDGTAPLSVVSTTRVDNLNVQFLDGHTADEFALVGDYLDLSGGNLTGALSISGGGFSVDAGSTSSPISLVAGSAPSNGIGGALDLSAGGGYNDRGGHVSVQSGNTSSWSAAGNSSDVTLRGGTVDGQTSYAEIRVQGGRAVAGGTTHSDGGTLTLRGGDATGSNRNGGNVVLLPGTSTGSGTPGRVGVGTGAPQNPLHVAGSSGQYTNLADGVHMGIDASNNVHIELVKNGGSPYIDFNSSNSGDTQARIRLAASNRLEVEAPNFTANGNVGVGTTAPQSRLHVEGGDIRTSGSLISTATTGTAPLSVASTTRVDNLNVQFLDGYDASQFARNTDLHDRYDDTEAVAAMGAKDDANPLNHDRFTGSDIAEATPRRKRIALRKWYTASTAASFTAGLGAEGMVFDGMHVWVANRYADTVTKIRAADGAPAGEFAVGVEPRALAFDGQHVWVGNFGGQSLTKLRAYDGAVMDTVPLATRVDDVEFDGTNLWVAHGNMSGTVSQVRPSDGAVLATYPSGGDCPVALEFDGTHLWIANWCSSGTVTKMDPADGTIVGSYPVFTCSDLAFDGENVWVTSGNGNQVVKLRASDGAVQGTYATGGNPAGVTFDGTHVWVLNTADDTMTRLRASDGSADGTFSTGDAPLRAVFDGAGIWVSNSGDGTLGKL